MAARKRLGEILIQAGVLAEPQLRAALTEQRRWGGPLGRILVDMKLITEEAMVQALSHQLNLPAVNLDNKDIAPEVLDLVPGEIAEQLSVMPFAVQGKFLDLAMVDPTNIGAIDTLRTRTRLNVRPYLAGPKAIERSLFKNYGRGVAPQVTVHTGHSGPQIPITEDALGFNTRLVGEEPARLPSAPQLPVEARKEITDVTISVVELRKRIDHLEALLARDEDVLRKLLAIVIEKGLLTREELFERLK